MPQAGSVQENTRIQLCGRLSIEIDGAQLADRLRGKQVRLLLAYLVLNRFRHIGREELIDALWPYQPPQSQDAALRTLLSRLRSALGAGSLVGRDELILQLPDPVWIDAEAAATEVQRAQETLDRGDVRSAWALAQVPLNIATRGLLPGVQATWLEPRRRELEDVRLHALEVIGRAGLSIGGSQLASVERAARTLIDAEPYRESGYVLLMESHAAQGNVAEAVRVFERLRMLLRDELGTMPSPDAIAVHERLLRPQARIAAGAGEAAAGRNEIPLPAELRSRAQGPLVGRAAQLEALSSLWAGARGADSADRALGLRGSGRIVLLTGDPGIGKTRLSAEFARLVHDDGALVIAGRAPEETLVPYQPFLEALHHYIANAAPTDLRVATREYGPDLARLVPELRRRIPDLTAALPSEPETDRYRLFEAVVGLLTAISATMPILLVLDDLQWADRPTLQLLRHLARAADPARLLILGAFRATETYEEGFADALADLRRERLVTQIEIPGLNEHETAELVMARTGERPSRAFTTALFEETEGNPFFIEEIVRHLAEAGVRASAATAFELQRFGLPEGVKQVIARRLARLDVQAMECLRVAAAIGRDFDGELLERVVFLNEDEFLDALDAALAAGLVIELSGEPGRYSFSHALVRETLYEAMSATRRARTHRRVGEALETQRDPNLAELAYHFTLAASPEEVEKAVTYAMRAGEQARALLAYEEAAQHYARALAVLERFEPVALERHLELLLALGEARVRGGERALGWAAFRRAAALAERLGDAANLARAAVGAARQYVQQPGVVDGELIAMLTRALEMSGGEASAVRVRLLVALCGALYYAPERDRMLELSAEALQIAASLGDREARAHACSARRRALWDPSKLKERLEASTEMLTLARQVGNLELELQAHGWLVVDLLEHGDRDAVDAQIEAFSAGAERLRQPLYLWNAIVWRAMRALLAGRLEEAEALATDALGAGMPAEAVTAPQYYAIQLLAIRREQGRMSELERPVREWVAANPDRAAWGAALAMLLHETGLQEPAREQFEQLAAAGFANIPQDGDWLTAITLLADVCAGLGDRKRAKLLFELLRPYVRSNVVVGLAAACQGSVARYLGKLAATIGRRREAADLFERALTANTRLRAPVHLAHAQLDYALVLDDSRRVRALAEAAQLTALELELPVLQARAAPLCPSASPS